MKYFEKSIEFLKQPGKAFKSVIKTGMTDAFKYMLVLSVIVSVLSGIITSFTIAATGLMPFTIIGNMIGMYIFFIIFSVIGGLWLHLWVYIFGGRKGLEQTLKTVFYCQTPTYLFGWIPLIGIIFSIWSVVLAGMGLMKLQSMTTGRVVIVLIIAIGIPLIIIASLIAFAVSILGPGILTGAEFSSLESLGY